VAAHGGSRKEMVEAVYAWQARVWVVMKGKKDDLRLSES